MGIGKDPECSMFHKTSFMYRLANKPSRPFSLQKTYLMYIEEMPQPSSSAPRHVREGTIPDCLIECERYDRLDDCTA
jgi:hypothetical protein